jgi:hypothetical protein
MNVQPYLFFEGRAEEALGFYTKALGTKVDMLMRNREAPEPPPPGMLPPGSENKVMHASFKVGDTDVMLSALFRQGELHRLFTVRHGARRGRRARHVQRPRRGWQRDDADRQDLLVAVLRHVDRPLRRRLDGHRRSHRLNPTRGEDDEG